jgi:hypothetical protein
MMRKHKSSITLLSVLLLCTAGICSCSRNDTQNGRIEKILIEAEKDNRLITVLELGNSLKKDSDTTQVITRYYNYSEEYDKKHVNNEFGAGFTESSAKWLELENKGLVKYRMTEKRVPNDGGEFLGDDGHRYRGKDACPHQRKCWFYDAFEIRFTPAAEKHVTVERMPAMSSGANSVTKTTVKITGAVLDKITIKTTNLSADKAGGKTLYVDYVTHFKPTAFGAVYVKQEELQKEKHAIFKLYDDGWRLWM